MLKKIHDAPAHGGNLRIDLGIVDSKRLQMFYVAAKEESFAAAASVLGVSASAISHALKGLEEDLGCALFRRSGPHVQPTGAGVRLLPMVEDLLTRMASMRTELSSMNGRIESLVFRISAGLLGILRPDVLSTFRECFPSASVEVLMRGDGREPAFGRRIDFEMDYAEAVPSGAMRRELVSERMGIYVAPFHALGRASRIGLVELRNHLLLLPDRSGYDFLMWEIFSGLDSDAKCWILPGAGCAKDLAVQGQGLAFLPEWTVKTAVSEGSLVPLKLTGHELSRTCCVWWSAQQPLTWIAEVFLDLLAGECDRRLVHPQAENAELSLAGQ